VGTDWSDEAVQQNKLVLIIVVPKVPNGRWYPWPGRDFVKCSRCF
jgi:hypothetical protein